MNTYQVKNEMANYIVDVDAESPEKAVITAYFESEDTTEYDADDYLADVESTPGADGNSWVYMFRDFTTRA